MVIGPGRAGEIWVSRRDGADARQITSNERAEGDLSWAPDGTALTYSSADSDEPRALTWDGWSRLCAASEVRVVGLVDAQEHVIAPGCQPAFAPDGRRIAFAAPPASQPPELNSLGANNAVRLVNRQGQNGWSLAAADGQSDDQGYLVYAPAWVPSGAQIIYQRYLGYRALVDINIIEISASFKRDGKALISGAGWMLPPHIHPGGTQAALIEHNVGDARGGSGYETWRLSVVRLGVAGSMFLPSGEVPTVGSMAWQASRVTAAAWSPDGTSLALALPAGWSRDDSAQNLLYQAEGAGVIWRWGSDGTPQEPLAENVDYASPLLWLP
jgi:Tol biopolymer transport system component